MAVLARRLASGTFQLFSCTRSFILPRVKQWGRKQRGAMPQASSYSKDEADFAVWAESFIVQDRPALTYPEFIADADQLVVIMPYIDIY